MDERFDRVDCTRVMELAPTFVDGEVRPEALASAVRKHLIDCAACRSVVQEATALSQWFVPTEDVPVPTGFAARVVRVAFADNRAFADERARDTVLRPVGRLASVGAHADVAQRNRGTEFAMLMTAVAAAALFLVTLLIASDKRDGLNSDDGVRAEPRIEEQLRQLDELNELEAAGQPGTAPLQETAPK